MITINKEVVTCEQARKLNLCRNCNVDGICNINPDVAKEEAIKYFWHDASFKI